MIDTKGTLAISLKLDTLKELLEDVQTDYDPKDNDFDRGYKSGIRHALETILSDSRIEI